MIRYLTLAGVCVAALAGPAAAQDQGTATTGAAATGATTDASAAAEALPELDAVPEAGAEVEALIGQSTAAQQFGILATTKATSGLVGDLGDVMVLLHSQILDRLRGEEASPGDAAMPAEEQERLDALANLNDQEFATGFAEWIVASYPGMIEAWQSAGEAPGFQDLSQAVVEQLEAQLGVAEMIAAGEDTGEIDEATREALSWGGAMDQGDTAQQPGDQSSGITTEQPSEAAEDPSDEGGREGDDQPAE